MKFTPKEATFVESVTKQGGWGGKGGVGGWGGGRGGRETEMSVITVTRVWWGSRRGEG